MRKFCKLIPISNPETRNSWQCSVCGKTYQLEDRLNVQKYEVACSAAISEVVLKVAETKKETTPPRVKRLCVEAFVPVRDYMDCLPGIVHFFERQTVDVRLVIHDNGSTYPPLLDFYDFLENHSPDVASFEIIYGDNLGTHHVRTLHSDPLLDYFITDADYDLSPLPNNTIEQFSHILNSPWALEQESPIQKVGSALSLFDIPINAIQRHEIVSWESVFWKTPVGLLDWMSPDLASCMFHADIDNTPGLLRKDSPFCYSPCIRVAGPYTARHVPWYITDLKGQDSYKYYLQNLDPTLSGVWTRHNLRHFKIRNRK